MAEDCGADGPCKEGQRKGCERFEGSGAGVAGWEEQLWEYEDRGCRVDIEVEKLDRGAYEAREEYALWRILRLGGGGCSGERPQIGVGHRHLA